MEYTKKLALQCVAFVLEDEKPVQVNGCDVYNYRTKFCRYGKFCARGEKCMWAHDVTELRDRKDPLPPKLLHELRSKQAKHRFKHLSAAFSHDASHASSTQIRTR